MAWKDIKEGWGLEEVPADLKKDLCCSICQTTKGKLYCGQSLAVPVDPAAGFEKWRAARAALVERVRNYVFCRFHAEWYYKD